MKTNDDIGNLLTSGSRRVHLIGVAGSGMSGIAGLLLSLGHQVSGCDLVDTVEVKRLKKVGLVFHTPQSADYIEGAEIVIYSSAIKLGNPAYDEARRLEVPLFLRAHALAAILALKKGIVVAGMHGKTTVSAMAAHVLRAAEVHPSHYVGAEIPILGVNANWDEAGEYFVAEGDESDGTLNLYHPHYSVVLNIEPEHLDHYRDFAAIETVFRELMAHTADTVFYCLDDPHAARICGGHQGAKISFGESLQADYRFVGYEIHGFQSVFRVERHGEPLGTVILNVPGKHNVSNAMSVLALAMELGVEFATIANALATFRGAKRRFEEKYRSDAYLVLDDYGHHPTEIVATLATAKDASARRRVVMFQPHRYSRTLALQDEFGISFNDADVLIVADVYPASEQPLPGVSGQTIVDAVRASGFAGELIYQSELQKVHQVAGQLAQHGDLFLSLGAGNIHEQTTRLAADFSVLEELAEAMGGGVAKLYEPLAKHTTIRIGGPAQFWLEPETLEGFARILRYCNETNTPLMVIGRGSNLLVRDGGVRGAVVHLKRGEFGQLVVDGNRITAGVGVKLRQFCYAARDAGLGGFESLEGIPGNVGGSLRMNAGAMGGTTCDHLVEIRTIGATGVLQTVLPEALDIRYRNVPFLQDNYAVSAVFEGQPTPKQQILERLDASMQKRRSSQPAASSAGCIFKNPAECPAGKLVEELGFKGFSIGKARVSLEHGNFIVNDGGASAADVLELIDTITSAAAEKRNITMETEVQIVGKSQPI